MIRLREALHRGLKKRWVGPIVLVLLAVLLVLVLCHLTIDAVLEGGVACLLLVVVLGPLVMAACAFALRLGRTGARARGRASPVGTARVHSGTLSGSNAFLPLRL